MEAALKVHHPGEETQYPDHNGGWTKEPQRGNGYNGKDDKLKFPRGWADVPVRKPEQQTEEKKCLPFSGIIFTSIPGVIERMVRPIFEKAGVQTPGLFGDRKLQPQTVTSGK